MLMTLQVGAIFIILATSTCGALFPVLNKRIDRFRNVIPGAVFDFAKYVSAPGPGQTYVGTKSQILWLWCHSRYGPDSSARTRGR